MLCDICETIFSGGGEPAPGAHDEYYHHRSARSFKTAIADGCQLCSMLWGLLPEHMLVNDWEHQSSAQEDSSLHMPCIRLDQPSRAASNANMPTYRCKRSFYRQWYMGRRGQNEGLKLEHLPETTDFSLVYFRSDNLTGLPTIEFITVGPAGRAGIVGIFPTRILLFDQSEHIDGLNSAPNIDYVLRLLSFNAD